MDWLLDLMGYIGNLAYTSTPVQNVDLKEVHAAKTICRFQGEKKFGVVHILSQHYYSLCFHILEDFHFQFMLRMCIKTLTLNNYKI